MARARGAERSERFSVDRYALSSTVPRLRLSRFFKERSRQIRRLREHGHGRRVVEELQSYLQGGKTSELTP